MHRSPPCAFALLYIVQMPGVKLSPGKEIPNEMHYSNLGLSHLNPDPVPLRRERLPCSHLTTTRKNRHIGRVCGCGNGV